jgi:hypothetical protein
LLLLKDKRHEQLRRIAAKLNDSESYRLWRGNGNGDWPAYDSAGASVFREITQTKCMSSSHAT